MGAMRVAAAIHGATTQPPLTPGPAIPGRAFAGAADADRASAKLACSPIAPMGRSYRAPSCRSNAIAAAGLRCLAALMK